MNLSVFVVMLIDACRSKAKEAEAIAMGVKSSFTFVSIRQYKHNGLSRGVN
jgi:hypothetical protein